MIGSILSRAVLAVVLFASGVIWEAPPVIIGAFVIGASTVPIVLRSIRENRRLRSRVAGELEASLETRLQEMEERQEAELSYVEEQAESRLADTTRRLEELEDRLEFAERTIAKLNDTDPANDPNRLQVMTPI